MGIMEVVVKICVHDDVDKRNAMKAVTTLPGIDSISMDIKEQKMTVIGNVDPTDVLKKLRKLMRADIVTAGPPKKPEKKEEAKKPAEEKVKEKADGVNVCGLYQKPEWIHYSPSRRFFVEYEEHPSPCVIC